VKTELTNNGTLYFLRSANGKNTDQQADSLAP